MGRRYDTISFLSDLGTRDETVGVVKAVLRDLAPHATVVDLTHEIAPYDVRGGSLALARSISYVPSGVVLASVDAIAESGRPLIAIEVADGEGVLVGPDNGLLAPAVAMTGGAGRAVYLSISDALPSAGACHFTRDVLAAAAARLCNGADLLELGEPADPEALLPGVVPLPRPFEAAPGVVAEVLWVDRQGNVQLNIGLDDVAGWGDTIGRRVQVAAGTPGTSPTPDGQPVVRVAERVEHAGSLGAGSVGLAVDAYGLLTLVLQRRSAAEELQVGAGDQVAVSPLAANDGVTTPVGLGPRR
jgi:S-adenosylmethionine hydrolase